MKFIPMELYNEITSELSNHKRSIDDMQQYGLDAYENDVQRYTREIMGPLKEEQKYLGVHIDKLSGLDRWCGSCSMGMHNCDVRVNYLKAQYGNTERVAKVNIMNQGKCLKV